MTSASIPVSLAGKVTSRLLRSLEKYNLNADNKKIQKLLYYVHGWSFALENKSLFDPNPFQAWKFGPVCQEIYEVFRRFGWKRFRFTAPQEIDETLLISLVASYYGKFEANTLEEMTHKESPWKDNFDGSPFKIISDEDIREYFSQKQIMENRVHAEFIEDYYHQKDSRLMDEEFFKQYQGSMTSEEREKFKAEWAFLG